MAVLCAESIETVATCSVSAPKNVDRSIRMLEESGELRDRGEYASRVPAVSHPTRGTE